MKLIKKHLEGREYIGTIETLLSPIMNLTGIRHENHYRNSGKKMVLNLRNIYDMNELHIIKDYLGGEIKGKVLELELEFIKVLVYGK